MGWGGAAPPPPVTPQLSPPSPPSPPSSGRRPRLPHGRQRPRCPGLFPPGGTAISTITITLTNIIIIIIIIFITTLITVGFTTLGTTPFIAIAIAFSAIGCHSSPAMGSTKCLLHQP
ncbi:hypothetical protein TURU_026701 [Turdus rufiventris]|nr:hypothetical protein TURU_026701 [Turdus rufiventris]